MFKNIKEKRILKKNTENEEINELKKDLERNEDENHDSKLNILFKFLKSLKIGSNVSNIQVPIILISPISGTEMFLNGFLQNFDLLLKCNNIDDDFERFNQTYRYLVSSLFHFSVYQKPLNPILGETLVGNFHCMDGDGNIETENYYFLETYSHHPPCITGCVYNKKYGVRVNFDFALKFIFMGTYIKIELNGVTRVFLEKNNERYECYPPYACGRIFRGYSEMYGDASMTSNKSKYKLIIKHLEKPLIGGDYDGVEIYIYNKQTKKNEYFVYGSWSEEMMIKDLKTKEIKTYYKRKNSSMLQKYPDISLPTDSNKVWKGVLDAHNDGNNKLKSFEKKKVEQFQRQLDNERKHKNIIWSPILFKKDEENKNWELICYK